MPRADITAVTVSQIWDDDSSTETVIQKDADSEGNPFVSVMQDGSDIRIYVESWDDIKEQVETMVGDILNAD